jgi:hypothetical protein
LAQLWRELSAHRGDVVAVLLISLLTSGWFLMSRTAPDSAPDASATRGPQSAVAADASRTPTTAPSPGTGATPGPGFTPGFTTGFTPGFTPRPGTSSPPSGSGTAGPSQSGPPAPSNTATPTATPAGKTPATPGALPDLLAVDYGVDGGQVVCGAENTSYVTVQNSGKAAAPKGIVVLFQLFEGANVKPTWSDTQTISVDIAPGGSYTLKAVFKLAEPCKADLSRTWSFSIDPANAVPESKEDNNSAAISIKSASG